MRCGGACGGVWWRAVACGGVAFRERGIRCARILRLASCVILFLLRSCIATYFETLQRQHGGVFPEYGDAGERNVRAGAVHRAYPSRGDGGSPWDKLHGGAQHSSHS
jgi:hypothetical protein